MISTIERPSQDRYRRASLDEVGQGDRVQGLAGQDDRVQQFRFGIEVRVAGNPVEATVTKQVFYDPEGARLRM